MPVWQSILGYISEKYNLYKKERFHKIIFASAGNYSDVLEIANKGQFYKLICGSIALAFGIPHDHRQLLRF